MLSLVKALFLGLLYIHLIIFFSCTQTRGLESSNPSLMGSVPVDKELAISRSPEGAMADPAYDTFPGIGMLRLARTGGMCTGTLIRDQYVLTAAHCIDHQGFNSASRNSPKYIAADPSAIFVISRRHGDGIYRQHHYRIAGWGSFVEKKESIEADGLWARHDLALLRLAEKVPAHVAAPHTMSATNPTALTLLDTYGYGGRNIADPHHEFWDGGIKRSALSTGNRWFGFGSTTSSLTADIGLMPSDSGGPTVAQSGGTVYAVTSSGMGLHGAKFFADVVAKRTAIIDTMNRWDSAYGLGALHKYRVFVPVVLNNVTFNPGTAAGSLQATWNTSITYHNTGDSASQVTFVFIRNDGTRLVHTISEMVPRNTGGSLYVPSVLSAWGPNVAAAVVETNQPFTVTVVQNPTSSGSVVKNRPIANGIPEWEVGSSAFLPNVTEGWGGRRSFVFVQNTSNSAKAVTVSAVRRNGETFSFPARTIPAFASSAYRIADVVSQSDGSVVVRTNSPGSIVAMAMELDPSSVKNARAYESMARAGYKSYLQTALCNYYNDTSEVTILNPQPVGGLTTWGRLEYINLAGSTSSSRYIEMWPGRQTHFSTCAHLNNASFNGSMTLRNYATKEEAIAGGPILDKYTSLIAMGSLTVNPTFDIAESNPGSRLSAPYIRWASDSNYADTGQRTFLAIQNMGSKTATSVRVHYYNSIGTLVGSHNLGNIEPKQKKNSYATCAVSSNCLAPNSGWQFGYSPSFGGSAIIEADPTSSPRLGALVRVGSANGGASEDYSAQPIFRYSWAAGPLD